MNNQQNTQKLALKRETYKALKRMDREQLSEYITNLYIKGYEAGKGQPSFDKQYVRDWLKANPDSDYLLPEEVVTKTVDKYKEAFKLLTGNEFH